LTLYQFSKVVSTFTAYMGMYVYTIALYDYWTYIKYPGTLRLI